MSQTLDHASQRIAEKLKELEEELFKPGHYKLAFVARHTILDTADIIFTEMTKEQLMDAIDRTVKD